MRVYKYESYGAYVDAQTEANRKKIGRKWVDKSTIDLIAKAVKYQVRRILCHGTRNGAELQFFKASYPLAWVVGTEISPTATQFPDTIQHDFHEPIEHFAGRFDLIYSNSFDHAYDPIKALSTWRDQLAPGRRLFVEVGLDPTVNVSVPSDPLQIEDKEIRLLIAQAGLRFMRNYRTIGGGNHKSVLYVAERPQ